MNASEQKGVMSFVLALVGILFALWALFALVSLPENKSGVFFFPTLILALSLMVVSWLMGRGALKQSTGDQFARAGLWLSGIFFLALVLGIIIIVGLLFYAEPGPSFRPLSR